MRLAALVLSLLALALAGCGGNETQGEREEDAASPAHAVEQIGEVRELLGQALKEYREGNAEEAERLVGDAYLEHFEDVEHPLEERDRELMEELEVLISTTIRSEIKKGAPVAEVEKLVGQANEKLDEAERLLREES